MISLHVLFVSFLSYKEHSQFLDFFKEELECFILPLS